MQYGAGPDAGHTYAAGYHTPLAGAYGDPAAWTLGIRFHNGDAYRLNTVQSDLLWYSYAVFIGDYTLAEWFDDTVNIWGSD